MSRSVYGWSKVVLAILLVSALFFGKAMVAAATPLVVFDRVMEDGSNVDGNDAQVSTCDTFWGGCLRDQSFWGIAATAFVAPEACHPIEVEFAVAPYGDYDFANTDYYVHIWSSMAAYYADPFQGDLTPGGMFFDTPSNADWDTVVGHTSGESAPILLMKFLIGTYSLDLNPGQEYVIGLSAHTPAGVITVVESDDMDSGHASDMHGSINYSDVGYWKWLSDISQSGKEQFAISLTVDTYGLPRCADGTVNQGLGSISNVLLVNNSAGDSRHTLNVAPNTPVTLRLNTALAGPSSAKYVVWVWASDGQSENDIYKDGFEIGCTVNPTPVNGGQTPQPIRCIKSPETPAAACRGVREFRGASVRAPWTINIVDGFSSGTVLTFQGVIQDEGSATTAGYSTTNSVTLRVQ